MSELDVSCPLPPVRGKKENSGIVGLRNLGMKELCLSGIMGLKKRSLIFQLPNFSLL